MINISGYGLSGVVQASNTFPQGFVISAFADDMDPLDSPDFTAADTASGLNGDLLVWSRANAIEVGVSVVPDSEEDRNLEALLNANRVGKNKSSAQDVIGLVVNYPDGKKATCSNGTIVVGPVMPSIQSTGRMRSRQYRFRFETVTKG